MKRKMRIQITAKKVKDGYVMKASNGDEMPSYIFKTKADCIRGMMEVWPKKWWNTRRIKHGVSIDPFY